MRYLVWLFRAALFLLLLGFAVKNDQPTVLYYFFGFEWHASLLVVLLIFFALGMAFGILALLGTLFRQRREIARMKHELQNKRVAADAENSESRSIVS